MQPVPEINAEAVRKFGEAVSQAVPQKGWCRTRKIAKGVRGDLADIKSAFRRAAEASSAGQTLGAPFQWIFDNYYICESDAKTSARDIAGVSRLPRAGGVYQGLPAIYGMARGLCIFTNNALSEELIEAFLQGAQAKRYFGSAELWAFPTSLRVALVSIIAGVCRSLEGRCASKRTRSADRELEKMLKESEAGIAASLGNAIRSLKFLATFDFSECFRLVSRVEEILERDPAGAYARMDEPSKAYYRRAVIELARKRGQTEEFAAEEALRAAKQGKSKKSRHIGFHILKAPAYGTKSKAAGAAYIAALLTLSAAAALGIGFAAGAPLLAALVVWPVWGALKGICDRVALRIRPPFFLPRMDLSRGIPDDAVTLAVISALVSSPSRIKDYIYRMERFWYLNRDKNLKIALLADLKESKTERADGDEDIISAAREQVRALNEKHGGAVFQLMLRERKYSRTQRRYMGWERKRGAIIEAVRFIRGEDCMAVFEGDEAAVRSARYVIALDSDTNLHMDCARELIAAMLHPLNRPEIDGARGVVTSGYGLLQPRIGVDLEAANHSPFAKVMAGHGGVDNYSAAVSDIYQDLFGEGIFNGKGIFDVNAFYRTLNTSMPEGRILSHDMLEGCYLRTGLISDVELTDGFPSSVASFYDRHHRWVRGDWQASPYLLRRVRNSKGEKVKNPIGALGRWKIFDNLRRSLSEVLLVAALIFAAAAGGAAPWVIAGTLAACVFAELIIGVGATFVSGDPSRTRQRYHSSVMGGLAGTLARAAVRLTFMLYAARISLDAVLRTIGRLAVTKRNLLLWVTASDSDARFKSGLPLYLKRMWPELAAGLLMATTAPNVAIKALGVIWALSPFAAHALSRRSRPAKKELTPSDREFITEVARDSYNYFRDFMTAENNYLPPDNFQESPLSVQAHRTSPTNIGVAMLCVLSARDFGFISTQEMAAQLEGAMSTLERMEKWNGHLYNWYNTKDLSLLRPCYVSTVDCGNFKASLIALRHGILEYREECPALHALSQRVDALLSGMDFGVFYDKTRGLFHIGYDAEKDELGDGYYDLLMSEARIVSYMAAADKTVPKKHWSALGRTLVRKDRYVGMASWTGTMFEYFMPHLLLPVFENSQMYESLKFAVYCHRRRAERQGVPWGISESGFYAFDTALNYQYKAFGVQKLGLKRGLGRELVVAPYASCLALAVEPREGVRNLRRLRALGAYSKYGFYEAIDYTPERVGDMAIVRSFMAHHLGMSMLMCANALMDGCMQRRFFQDAVMASAVELLQERIPDCAPMLDDVKVKETPARERYPRPEGGRQVFAGYDLAGLRGQVYGNGSYTAVLTDAGLGFSRCGSDMICRFRPEKWENPKGIFTLINAGGQTFSSAPAPVYNSKARYKTEFGPHYAAYFATLGDIRCDTVISVHGSLPLEAREITLSSDSDQPERAEILLYFEPVLETQAADQAHPAFSNLFIESEYDADGRTLIYRRRPRTPGEGAKYLAVGVDGGEEGSLRFDTFRDFAVLRHEGAYELQNLFGRELKGNTGACIDPACIVKLAATVPPGGRQTVTVHICTGKSREQCVQHIADARADGMEALLAGARECCKSQRAAVMLSEDDDTALTSLLPGFYFGDERRRALSDDIALNTKGQSELWKHGVSGDNPILAVELAGIDDLFLLMPYARMHRYLALKGIVCDLVIMFCEGGDYTRPFFSAIKKLLGRTGSEHMLSGYGGVHLINLLSADFDAATVLRALSSVYIRLPEDEEKPHREKRRLPPRVLALKREGAGEHETGPGGVVMSRGVHPGQNPWCSVLANHRFGTVVSDKSLGYTWAFNARENKLSPWRNDTVYEQGERVILGCGGRLYDMCASAYKTRFVPGGAWYEYMHGGVSARLCCFVDKTLPAKVVMIEMSNNSDEPLDISLSYNFLPVMGVGAQDARHVSGELKDNALLLRNPYNSVYRGMTGFITADAPISVCGDALDLIAAPGSGSLPPSPDPTATATVRYELPPRRSEKVSFVLGMVSGERELELVKRRVLGADMDALRDATLEHFHEQATGIEIHTPDEKLNKIINLYMPWQTLSSRIFGRTGFYQCGGAFGFRDQLQDCMAVALTHPELVRRHIIRSAAHQFVEGDVQHWWHGTPHERGKGHKGVRTRYSDDLLWLPYVACDYIDKTGDHSVMDVRVAYIEGRELGPEEHEVYFQPDISQEKGSVYEHCLRAIEHASRYGAHGAPLIKGGDWNDGMNRVGTADSGESVWLGWFLSMVCDGFAKVCDARGDSAQGDRLRERAATLRDRLEEYCWDGSWYLRGFYHDGATLGSHADEECRIDSISQSFAALASTDMPERKKQAMQSVYELLYDREQGFLRLFWPPFISGPSDPGYIKGYVAGIRENGGQYTHAAVWAAMGFLAVGDTETGYSLLRDLNPLSRAEKPGGLSRYRLEPYAMPADVYANPAHYGRGGWSLYTGAAGWYCTAVLESLLGIRFKDGQPAVRPNIPASWDGYTAKIRTPERTLSIEVRRGADGFDVLVDGERIGSRADVAGR